MKPWNARDLAAAKGAGQKLTMLTCSNYWSAQILNRSDVDLILVGDSLAMVEHGYPDTLHATLDMMRMHTAAVARGAPDKMIVADMPFMTFRKGKFDALDAAGALLRAGAQAVKLEGVAGHEGTVRHLVESGVPVMGHLGLTPQSHHQLGGYRVQGRAADEQALIRQQAQRLQDLGAFSLVLECVPAELAGEITNRLKIPVIGIGAGADVDGQVLVLPDLLGLAEAGGPRFVRRFADLHAPIRTAVNRYCAAVRDDSFPSDAETYR